MQKTTWHKQARMLCTALVLFVLFSLFPFTRAEAAQVTIKIDMGGTLESALLATFAREGEVPYEEIDRLVITGNGKLSEADGFFIRENLTGLHTLNLRGFTGSSEGGAFRGCTSLVSVMLPERFVISREMFYGCSSLEEVVWPVHYQLTKDCFAYCALDFSDGYPNLLNDRNVLTYAASQRPKVYFTMPGGNSGTISAGGTFNTPYDLQTRGGASYPTLVSLSPNWLLTRESELDVTTVITRDGERLDELDTSEPGVYEITYSLPYATGADTRTQTYTLTILPGQSDLDGLVRQAKEMSQDDYTEASWNEFQLALDEAEQLTKNTRGVQQSRLESARQRLEDAIAALEATAEGVPISVTVGESFEVKPEDGADTNQDNWEWDDKYLSADFTITANFTALRAGKTEIHYTGGDGETGTMLLTILEEGESAPAALNPGQSSGTPVGAGPWLFTVALYALLGGSMLALRAWYKSKEKEPVPAASELPRSRD